MNIGDMVKFLNDTGGGIITKFLDPHTVLVKIEDGFEVPVKISEVIPDRSDSSDSITDDSFRMKVASQREKPETGIQNIKSEEVLIEHENSGQVYLAFTRGTNPFKLQIHLINDTDYHIYFIIGLRKMEQQLYQYSDSLEANTKVVLGNFKISKTDESTIFAIQYISFKKGYYIPSEPVSKIIEINTQKLSERKYDEENDYFDAPAAIYNISAKKFPESLKSDGSARYILRDEFIKEKETIPGKKTGFKKSETDEIMEVDLHIQEIIDDESGLTDGEILDIQIRRFEMALETALRGNVKKIIFIHGVGQGKLKYEISKTLNKKYPDLKYQDASFKEYGYGATMVLLRT